MHIAIPRFLVALVVVVIVTGCHSAVYKDTRPTAVASPEQLADQTLKGLQSKHFQTFISVASASPFPMKVASLGFVRQKGNVYVAINLIGEIYNDIKTTTATRLSNEFHTKYKKMASLFLPKGLGSDSYGLRILLEVAHYNFVTQKSYTASAENLELFTPWPVVSSFIVGDITGQELVSKSLVFVNGQRTDFTLTFL